MNRIKKISRKVISYVLALVMVFSTMTGIVPGMSLTAHAAESIGDTGLSWEFNSGDGTLHITGSGVMPDYKSSGDNQPPWKEYKNSIEKVVIDDGVKNIGANAFTPNYVIKSVTIPGSVKSIGANAFAYCNGLNNVTIPDGVKSIEDNAFSRCENLTNIKILGSVESIGTGVFSYVNNNATVDNFDISKLQVFKPSNNDLLLNKITIIDNITDSKSVTIKRAKDDATDGLYAGQLLYAEVADDVGEYLYYWSSNYSNSNRMTIGCYSGADTYVNSEHGNTNRFIYVGKGCYIAGTAMGKANTISCTAYKKVNNSGTWELQKVGETSTAVTAASGGELEDSLSNLSVLLLKGETEGLELRSLLGRAGLAHITCSNTIISNINIEGGGCVELNGSNIVPVANKSGSETVSYSIRTSACTYHGTQYTADSPYNGTIKVYVIGAKVKRCSSKSITLSLEGLPDGEDAQTVCTINDANRTSITSSGRNADTVTFNNLTPGTEYQILIEVTDPTSLTGTTKAQATCVATTAEKPAIDVTATDTTLTVIEPVGDGYTYSIDGDNYQSGVTFTGLHPGTNYTVYAKEGNGAPKSADYTTGLTVGIKKDGTAVTTDTDIETGTELTADVVGKENASFTYQWYRTKDDTETLINGATDSTYTTTADDLGCSILVKAEQTEEDVIPASDGESNPTKAVVGKVQTVTPASGTIQGGAFYVPAISTENPRTGDEVSIYVKPDKGYGPCNTITIAKTENDTTTVEQKSGPTEDTDHPGVYKYTYIQPDYPVTITPEFSKLEYTIGEVTPKQENASTSHGYISIVGVTRAGDDPDPLAEGKYYYGDTIQINVMPENGYVLSAMTLTYNDGTEGTYTLGNGIIISGNNYTFTMPAGNVTGISGTFSRYTELTEDNKPTISVSDNHNPPVIGDTLTATTTATDVIYQWYRGDTPITGATNATYTLTKDDFDKAISVQAIQTKKPDGSDYGETARPTQNSAATSAVVKKTPSGINEETAKNNITIDYAQESVTPKTGYEVSVNGTTPATSPANLADVFDGEGTPTIYVRTSETDDTSAGEWVAVTLPERPAAPTWLGSTNAANGSSADGTITGVDDTMEYSSDNTTWNAVISGSTTINDLNPGIYYVRVKATDSAPHGVAATVTVYSSYIALDDTTRPEIFINNGHNTPQIGDTLTATTTATDLIYQWYKDDYPIDGANQETYTTTVDDLGKAIKVKVTQTKKSDGTDYGINESPEQTSDETAAVVKKASPAAPASVTEAGFVPNYEAETFDVGDNFEVSSTNSDTGVIADGSLTDVLNGSGKVYIRLKETGDTEAGAWLEVTLSSRPDAPTGLGYTNADNGNTANGTITGSASTMEYKNKADGGEPASWTAISGDTVSGLKPGTYLVRTKATESTPHGVESEVVVGSNYVPLTESAPVITIKTKATGNTETGIPQIGDTLTASPSPSNASPTVYEWYRDTTKIDGEAGADYVLTADDAGKKIHVIAKQAAGADGAGGAEVTTAPSADTEIVKKKTNTAAKITVETLKGSTSKTGTSITVKPVTAGYEYAVVAKGTTPADNSWKTAESGQESAGLEFTGLDPGTEYDVLVRAKETDDTQPGEVTKITVVTDVTLTITGTPIQGKEVSVTLTPSVSGATFKWYIGSSSTPDGTGTKVVPTTGGAVLKVEAYAGDPEALIGTATTSDNVKTLATFISESTDSPVAVVLDGPVKGGITIPENKEVILDLKGQEVTGEIIVSSGSKLTIIDSSNPQKGTVKDTIKANAGDVIIKGGKYDNNPVATNPGTVVITGGMFENKPTLGDAYGIKVGEGEHYKYQVLPRATVRTTPESKTGLKSDGSNQALITAGGTDDGTMYYALGENGSTAPAFDGNSTEARKNWYTSVPKGKEAGTYYAWYMVKGDDTHVDTEPACITVNIAIGEPSVREVLTNAIDYTTGKFKESEKYEIFVGTSAPVATDPATEIPEGGYDLLENIVDVNHDQDTDNDKKLYVRIKKGLETSAWVYIPLPERQSTDGIAADYNRDTLTGVYEGVKYSIGNSDPATEWIASDSSDLTKAPVSWDGTSTKTLKFIVPGDQDKQLFPSKVKTITLGTKGDAPTADDLNGYPVEGDNIKPRSANLPAPKTDGVTLQYRYRKNPEGTWTSWGSSNKAIGLEMGTKYDYEVRFAPGKDEHGNPTPASKAFPVSPDTASFTTKMIKPDADEFLNKHVDYSATPAQYTGGNGVFEYSTNETGEPAVEFSAGNEIPDAPSGFYIRYKDTDKDTEGDSPSEWVFIPTRNIPSDVGEVDKTDEPITGAGGTLTGTDETMEYRYRKTGTDEWSDWMPCTSGMTGMSAGDYQIRKKGTDSGLPSFAKHLTIAGSTATATIAVTVEDSDHTPVTGAKVQATLVGGATVSGSADTENDGEYNITGLSAGTYLIVVTGTDGHQVTTLVDVKEVNHTVTLILPTGKENSSKLVDNTGNNIAVGGIDDQAAALDQSEPQKEYLITFKAEEKSEDASDETTSTAITGIKARVESESTYKDLEGNNVDVQKEFVDFTVEKKLLSNAGGTDGEVGDTEKISETSRVMEIVYPYPQITSRFGIMVWRYHNGVQKFTRLSTRPTDAGSMRDATYYIDRLDKRLYIYGQKFSTYSITYTESSEIADPEPYAKAETPDFTVQDNSDKEAGTVIITCDPSNAGKEIEAGYVTADGFWHPLPGPYIISADGTAKITGLPAGNIRIRIRAAESEYYKVGDWKEYTVKVSIGDPTKDFKEQVYVVHYILEYNGKQMTKTSEPVSYTAVNTHEDNDGNKYYGISANKEFFDAAAEKLLKKADNPTDRIISYSIVCKSVYADGSPVLKEGTAYAVEDKRISIEAGRFIDENGIAYNDIPYQYNDIYVYANVGAYATDKDTDGVVITSPVGVKYSGLPHKLSCDPGALKQGAGRSASYDLEISIYDTKTKKADGENYELKYGRDYTVSYRNNKNASVRVSGTPGNAYYRQIYDEADAASKWPKIMIVGKGNYSGMKSVLYFDILPASVNESYGAAGNFADAVKTSYVLGRKGGISLTPAPARYARNYDKYADTYVTNKLKTVRYSLGKDAAVELQKWDSASASWKRLGDLTNASMRRQVTASVVNPGAYRVKVTGLNDYCGEAYDEFSVYAYQSVMFSSLKLKTASVKYAAEGIGAEKLVTGIRTKVKNGAGKNVTIPASELSVTLLPVSESASVSTDGAKALSAGKYKAYVRPKDAADFAKKYPKVAIDSEATADVTVKGNRLNKKMFTLNLSTKGEACNGSAKDIGITLNGIKAEDVTLAKTVVKNGRTVNIPLTDSELKGALKVDSDTKITVRGRYTLNDGRTVDNSLPGTYRIILYGKKGYADTTCIISYKRISAALTTGKLNASPASFNVSGAMTTIRVTLPDGKSIEEISGTGNDLFKVNYKNNKATGDATATVTVRSDKTGYKKGSKAAVTFKVEPKKVSAVRSYNEYTDKLAGELFIKTAGTVRAGKKAPAIRLYQASADGKKLTEVNKKYYSGEYAANVSAANTYDLKLKGRGNGLELDRTVKEAYTTYAKEAGNWTGIKLGRDAYLIKDKADGRIYTSDDIKNVSTTTAVKDMGRGRYNVAYAGGCYVLPVIEQLTVDGHVLKLADGDYTISYKNNHKTGTAGMIVTLSAKTAREHGIGGSRKYNFKIVNQTDSGLTL